MKCTSRTNWAYYLSREDVLHYKKAGRLAAGFPLSYEPGNTAQQVIRPGKEPDKAARIFSLVTLGRDKDTLKKGDRVWVVSDGDSLTPVTVAASGNEPVFNDVYVPSAPVSVSAGDSLGHMGFYQLPEENGKRSRYQVHIECLSMDDMENFITNPGRVGEDAPVYLTWKTDAPLSDKSDTGITAGSRKTKISGVLTLAKVPGVDAEGNTLSGNQDAAYYQIRPEGGWLAAASVKKVSQYALGELGFVTLNKASESFDLIDGIKHPNNVVKGILEQLYKAAEDETRTSHALNKYNYQRLLTLIDSNQDGHYQEQEYLQAVHNISYRDRLYRVIAKHASEWYYGKDDPLWKTYLDTLTRDAPLWKTYLETFLDKMTWMKTVSEKGVALGSEPWHMHPIVFLNSIKKGKSKITREMLRRIWSDPGNVSDSVLDVVAEEFSNKFEVCNINTKNRLYHFFAQIYQEVGPTFNLNEGFNYRPQVLINKFAYYRNHPQDAQTDGYIPGRQVANKQNIANRAYGGREGNDNIASGDGWRYRGRGMKQLTFKNNYRSFTNYHERVWGERVDFESTPDLLVETVYAARSALYFWDQNNLFSSADNGISRAVSDSITRIVNLYDNHYEDRHNNLIRFLQEGIFDEIF
ncbi:lytic enzyme [Klebsiella pneumoniae]|nr:lytic enzyme [Klebsiella pneumoniae]